MIADEIKRYSLTFWPDRRDVYEQRRKFGVQRIYLASRESKCKLPRPVSSSVATVAIKFFTHGDSLSSNLHFSFFISILLKETPVVREVKVQCTIKREYKISSI
jgi:hypothetical protein